MEHVVLFQYGDYGATWRHLAAGLPETYRDQKVSVDFVAGLAARHRVTTLAICDRPHREELAPNLWSLGIDPVSAYRRARILPLLAGLAPSRLILRTPHRLALLWARWKGLPLLPVFADTFAADTLRQRIENRLAAWSLSGPNVPCVSNHSLNASLSMHRILGLPKTRIVPWDFPPLQSAPEPKPPFQPPGLRAFYAGLMLESKGVGDCLAAIALLRDQGLTIAMDFAGSGPLDPWQEMATRLDIAPQVRFLGTLANTEVRQRMAAAQIVLVPSRHTYAEGLPSTLSEALAARTPVIVSDHPAFANRLRPGQDCLVFRAADPADLAQRIRQLAETPALQRTLSETAPETLQRLVFGQDWCRLAESFIADPQDTSGALRRHALANLLPA